MKNDKETKSRLLASAKQEFMEKGYTNASLRSICKNAGVTTGALYFFFKDKEDLFASLVEEPLNKLQEVMIQHYSLELTQTEGGLSSIGDYSEDVEASKMIIHYLYQYYDEFQLLLTKSQGTRFAGCVDRFVAVTEVHYRRMADRLAEQGETEGLDDYMIHWLAHMSIDIFVHMLTHEKSEEAAIQHMEKIIRYLVKGWVEMFQ